MEAWGTARAKALRLPRETCHVQGTARRSVRLEMSEQGGEEQARITQGYTPMGFGSYSACCEEPLEKWHALLVF